MQSAVPIMLEPFIVITLSFIQLPTLASTIPLTESEFDCIEMPRKHPTARDSSLNSHLTITVLHEEMSLGNISQQRLNAPCFNATFPSSVTAEEGSDVTLPCVVHNVDFDAIVMSWWKEEAAREIAVGDNLSHERFSIDKSLRGGWSLRIANVSLRDSGVYICQINSRQLRERFISLSVSVKRPSRKPPPSNDVLVKDEAMRPRPSLNLSAQGSSWRPFLPALGYEWRQAETTSSAPRLSKLTSSPLLLPLVCLLTVTT